MAEINPYPINGYNFGDEGKFESGYNGKFEENNKTIDLSDVEVPFEQAYFNNTIEYGGGLEYRRFMKYQFTDEDINLTEENCTVSIEGELLEGSTVTIIVEPAEGYSLDNLTLQVDGETVIYDQEDGYEYTVQDKAPTISAVISQ